MISFKKFFLGFFVVLFIGKQGDSEAARILGVFPLAAKSHFRMGEVLFRELATRGHQVDVMGHFPLKNPPPNYRDISLAGTFPFSLNDLTLDKAENIAGTGTRNLFYFSGKRVCSILDAPQFRNIIENPPMDPPYDVAIIDIFAADCYLALGRHLNVPVVGVLTTILLDWLNQPLGNPQSIAFAPSCYSQLGQRMSYLERMKNFFLSTYIKFYFWYAVSAQLVDVEKHFDLKLSSMSELYEDMAVLLTNSHPSFDGAKPMSPRMVEVGGLHVVDTFEDLPSEVEKWLDDSKEGFVYFSFGSMVKIESFPNATISAFFEAFERIAPVRVLMKVTNKTELQVEPPKNVMISPWLPQIHVLKHQNIKAFVTHGGRMSILEAVTCGVPMIAIPICSDQHLNVGFSTDKNVSIAVNYREITADSFTQTLKTILSDSMYRNSSKRLAKLFNDRPMSALDTATFWVEYVIRNGNVLKSPSDQLAWWQLELLDIYASLIAASLLALYIVKLLLVMFFRALKLKLKFHECENYECYQFTSKSKKIQ